MAIKRYKLEYGSAFSVVVDIDNEKCTKELLHEINDFWGGSDDRLFAADEDVLMAVLKMLVVMAARVSIEQYWNAAETLQSAPPEGWPPLDGRYGITLISMDSFAFDDDEVSISSQDVQPA